MSLTDRRQPLFSSSRALRGTPIPTMTLALHALGSNGLIPLRLSLLVTRTIVELAIPCDKPGKRVFEGFTVGFHLRKWEISCFYVPPSLLSSVALARTTQSDYSNGHASTVCSVRKLMMIVRKQTSIFNFQAPAFGGLIA
nr:AT4G36440-like protein [Ipomoea batatas]